MSKTLVVKIFHLLQGNKKTVLVLLSVIFWIAAIGYSVYMKDRLPYPDEQWYFHDYAQNIAKYHIFSRDGINPTAFHPPVYPLLLGGVVNLGFGITAARLIKKLAESKQLKRENFLGSDY